MMIAVGSDHRGIELKASVTQILKVFGQQVRDIGVYDDLGVDYPDIARKVCELVSKKQCDMGILICGTGIGMSIAANKFIGIRAALCLDEFMAERARLHNDANVLCLGAERTYHVDRIIKAFLNNSFEGGRHSARIEKINQSEINTRNAIPPNNSDT